MTNNKRADNNNNNNWEVVGNTELNEECTPFVSVDRNGTASISPSTLPVPSAPEAIEASPVELEEEDEYSFKPASHAIIQQNNNKEDDGKPSAESTLPEHSQQVMQNKDNSNDDDGQISDVSNTSNVRASVAAGAVAGLLLGGPFLSIVGAAGAAMYVKERGVVGDVVRAGGYVASSVGDHATRLNKQHGCVSKAKEVVQDVGHVIRESSKDHKVWNKVKTSAENVGTKAKEIEHKHHLVENVLRWISNGFQLLAEKIKKSASSSSTTDNHENHNPNDDTKVSAVESPTVAAVPVTLHKSEIV